MNALENFHFLRPAWLLALIPVALLAWLLLRRADTRRTWQPWIDPVLLDALLVHGGEQRRFRPIHLLVVFWLVSVAAMAGPTWQREPSPFAEDKASLIIVLKVTPSMQNSDIAPSRLVRAAQKISDLLEQRRGARNALVAYAGSAHLVMPRTTDANVINTFAADLRPDLMPRPGDDTAAALALAQQQLGDTGQPGAILLITDDEGEDIVPAIVAHRNQGGLPVHLLVAAPELPDSAKKAAQAGGGSAVAMTPDSSDTKQLARSIQQTATASGVVGGERWQDTGYWLVPVLTLIGMVWFRRGWVLAND